MLEKNTGLKSIFTVRKVLNENNLDKNVPNIIPGQVKAFKYAKITLYDVE